MQLIAKVINGSCAGHQCVCLRVFSAMQFHNYPPHTHACSESFDRCVMLKC